jgi:hypothetical protein
MEPKKKKAKVYSDCPTTRRRKGIVIKSKSMFPDKEGVYPTNDKHYIVRIFDAKKHIYTTVAKIKEFEKATERLELEQKKQREFQEERLKEYAERRKNWNYERQEPTKNLVTGYDLKSTN